MSGVVTESIDMDEVRACAVKYCETHECNACVIYLSNLDKRTEEEKTNGQLPCSENLVTFLKGWVEDVQKT